MDQAPELTLGYIAYLNCVPFFHHLKDNGFHGRFITGVPSALNQMLQQGQLDVSPSSSFEYARNWEKYLLLPGHSISSVGKVESVLLFSSVGLRQLSGHTIAITGESATSINLLRVILREFYQLHDVDDRVPEESIELLIEAGQPALLIGDRALHLACNLPPGVQVFDLGDIWYRHTGLPFVFALWMIDRNALDLHSSALAELGEQLLQSRQQLIGNPYLHATVIAKKVGLNTETIVDYWNTIDYRLEKEHLRGLQLFFQLCEKYQLLEGQPELNFLD
ncbi:chorismate dehydratase [Desulfuromusa kysingii]|uniref:Chorismate dehydratase n=1 Tax=Desulfuromusa kysingii TaxID=37625 RepID=A0A1H4CZD2_9BACT|nr:menaquinone biosynthesis protein [Desulfuromusa kysingii]SEA65412.1 chorismate dehydratase [Desulfuromusa kysingii]